MTRPERVFSERAVPAGFRRREERLEVFVAGHPRSGNTWLDRLVSDLLDAPIQNVPGENIVVTFAPLGQGPYLIRKTHMTWTEYEDELAGEGYYGPCKRIFIQRDPRDVICSQIHYRQHKFTDKTIMSTIEEKRTGVGARSKYEDWIRGWLGPGRADFLTRFEWLHQDTVGELEKIHAAITGRTIARGIVENIVKRQSFARLKPLYPHSMWRGEVGTWRRYFKQHHARLMDEILGDFMLDQGYIPDRDWWKEVSE